MATANNGTNEDGDLPPAYSSLTPTVSRTTQDLDNLAAGVSRDVQQSRARNTRQLSISVVQPARPNSDLPVQSPPPSVYAEEEQRAREEHDLDGDATSEDDVVVSLSNLDQSTSPVANSGRPTPSAAASNTVAEQGPPDTSEALQTGGPSQRDSLNSISSSSTHHTTASALSMSSAMADTARSSTSSLAHCTGARPFANADKGTGPAGQSAALGSLTHPAGSREAEAEASRTLTTTSSGLLSDHATLPVSAAGSTASPRLTQRPASTAPRSPQPPRQGFLSGLLNRSASLKTRSQTGNVERRRNNEPARSPTMPDLSASASAGPNLSASSSTNDFLRPSSALGLYPRSPDVQGTSTAMGQKSHSRNFSTPVASPTSASRSTFEGPSRTPLLTTHDAVFASQSPLLESHEELPGSSSPRATSASRFSMHRERQSSAGSRVQRFRSHFGGASGQSNELSTTDSQSNPLHASYSTARFGSPAVSPNPGLASSSTLLPRSASIDSTNQGISSQILRSPSDNLSQRHDSLGTMGLTLHPLTPGLSMSRYGQPLCGSVLDGKYLLIGTSFGLDFLPLHRTGNLAPKSSLFERFTSAAAGSGSGSGSPNASSSRLGASDNTSATRTRKPINLIKKTRFKQLVILGERSHVLLAIAGRNEHVRVYALDALRALIQKKMKEIDEKEGYMAAQVRHHAPATDAGPMHAHRKRYSSPPLPEPQLREARPEVPAAHRASIGLGLGLGLDLGMSQEEAPSASGSSTAQVAESLELNGSAATAPGAIVAIGESKGKGRASPIPPPLALQAGPSATASMSGERSGQEAPMPSPPPAYAFPTGSTSTLSACEPVVTGSRGPSSMSRRRSSAASSLVTPRRRHFSRASISHRPTSSPTSPRISPRHSLNTSPREGTAQCTSASSSQSREFHASTPRALRQHRSRETLRRGSSSSALSSGVSMSRRGSAATVTQNTVAALQAPPSLNTVRRRSSAFFNASASAEQLPPVPGQYQHEMERLPSASTTASTRSVRAESADIPDDYEWIDESEQGPSTNESAVPWQRSFGIPSDSIASSTSASTGLSISTAPSSSSIASNLSTDASASSAHLTVTSNAPIVLDDARSTASANRRTPMQSGNLAETPASRAASSQHESSALTAVASSSASMRRSPGGLLLELDVPEADLPVSSIPISAGRRFVRPAITPRPSAHAARSPTASRNAEDIRSLTDFFKENPSTESADAEAMPQGRRSRLIPKSPTLQRNVDEADDGPSLIEIMRSGPVPSLAPACQEVSGSGSSEGEQETRRAPRKLAKSRSAKKLGSSPTFPKSRDATPTARSPADWSTYAFSSSEPALQAVQTPQTQTSSDRSARSEQLSLPGSLADRGQRITLQPRSPVLRNDRASDRPDALGMVPSLSLREMLSAEPEPAATRDRDVGIEGSLDQVAEISESMRNSPSGERRNRKRWSLLEGFRSPSLNADAPSFPTFTQTAPSPEQPSGDGFVAQSFETSPNTFQAVLPPSNSDHSNVHSGAPPLILKPRPSDLDDDAPPFANLQPNPEDAAADETTITYTSGTVGTTNAGAGGRSQPNGAIIGKTSSATGPGGAQGTGQSSNNATLDYVKLARTKGSRFIRASETKKRTYLAVLCGEQGERIELFTGSKNVSLSLNRTFVLPETPRTIEFQLQGEDLVDLYLIYDSAIFALEPTTVRVREVGIQRNERRQARRDRDLQARENAALEVSPAPASAAVLSSTSADEEGARGAAFSGQHAQVVAMPSQGQEPPTPDRPFESRSTQGTPAARQGATPAARTVTPNPASSNDASMASLAQTNPNVPYTTFQQLEYLPVIPPSALSSSYVIPPTYEAVLSASPMPSENGSAFPGGLSPAPSPRTGFNAGLSPASQHNSMSPSRLAGPSPALLGAPSPAMLSTHSPARSPALLSTRSPAMRNLGLSPASFGSDHPALASKLDAASLAQLQLDGTPLLSPVSLLANPTARNPGPPGLFFATKGRALTSIVDGDGRSVIRKPIAWSSSDAPHPTEAAEQAQGLDVFTRIEILMTEQRSKLVLAAFGPSTIKAIEVGASSEEEGIEVIPPDALKRRIKFNSSLAASSSMGLSQRELEDAFVRDVTFLAKSSESTFFAERVGSQVTIHAFGALGQKFV